MSCQTIERGLLLNNVNKPLPMIKEAVVSVLPLGLRATSPNGREFLSKYFVPGKDEFKEADTSPRRWFAHILVLGDRRPYIVEIYAKRERRVISNGVLTYVPEALDLRIANELRQRLEEALTKRREGTNIIDDFRAF